MQTDSEFEIDNTDDKIQSDPELEFGDSDETPLVDDELDPALFGDFLDNID